MCYDDVVAVAGAVAGAADTGAADAGAAGTDAADTTGTVLTAAGVTTAPVGRTSPGAISTTSCGSAMPRCTAIASRRALLVPTRCPQCLAPLAIILVSPSAGCIGGLRGQNGRCDNCSACICRQRRLEHRPINLCPCPHRSHPLRALHQWCLHRHLSLYSLSRRLSLYNNLPCYVGCGGIIRLRIPFTQLPCCAYHISPCHRDPRCIHFTKGLFKFNSLF